LTDWKAQFHVDEAIDDGRQIVLDVIKKIETYKAEFEGESGQIATFADLVDNVIDNLMQLNGTTDMGTIITDLQGISGSIPGLETQIGSLVTSLQTIQANVESTIASFNVWYTSNYVDFLNNGTVKEKTEETLDLIADAFDLLMNETSPNYIPTFFNDSIIDPILGVVDNYVNFAITEATTNIGQTSPLSNIYNATYTDICQEIVNPFNAVWSGLGWCLLLLLLPVTLVINSLRKLYCTSKRSPALRQYQSTDKGRPTMDRVVSYTEVPMSHLPPSHHPQPARYPVPDKYKAQR